ncbi:4498_t:CDS:2 [Ambispora gerdemannii]|uniref:4498_t:CDS:1 n=1 Tax=Ambispora gerdemannii TaxID=144530 RepID=A0A9N9AEM2_9GLOM|nr:4498_t:CDS:2 [Ambispora gerdemannii]
MKLQTIVLFLTASLASVIHTQACTVVYRGMYTHETGDVGGGCFGTDPSDPITYVETRPNPARPPVVCYVFYEDYGCNGKVVHPFDCAYSHPPGIIAKSVRITCPPGT